MALPSTPPIDLRMIADEIGLEGTVDLLQCLDASYLEDKSLPVDMLRFLGYSHVPPVSPPTAPPTVNTTVRSDGNITVYWGAGTGTIDQYRIERKKGTGSYEFRINWTDLVFRSFEDTTTTLDEEHTYRVRAENSGGVSDWTYSSTVIPTLNPPGQPKTPQYDNQRFYPNGIGIAWTPPTTGGPPSNYRIEFGTGSFIANVAAPNLSYIVPNSLLTQGSSYTFRVRAENAAGASNWLTFPSKTYN